MIDRGHDGHDWAARRRQVLGQIRAGLDSARNFIDGLPAPTEIARPARGGALPKGRLAAVVVAAALDLLARRERSRKPLRGKGPGLLKLAVLSAAVLAAGKLIAARR